MIDGKKEITDIEIPAYIIDIMSRATYITGKDYPGYSIALHKKSPYCGVNGLREDAERLVKFARKYGFSDGVAEFVYCPDETHYCDQYARVNLFDPVMRVLEKYMPENK